MRSLRVPRGCFVTPFLAMTVGGLEAVADGEVQAEFFRALTVRHVRAKRPDRRAPAHAEADADGEVEGARFVEGVARVDEDRRAEALGDPTRVFHAPERHVAPADDGVALRDADRFEPVAAHRL